MVSDDSDGRWHPLSVRPLGPDEVWVRKARNGAPEEILPDDFQPRDWFDSVGIGIKRRKRSTATRSTTSSEYDNPGPTSAKLAGILRVVANMPEGNRQGIGFWAAGKLLEAGYGPAAWDALEDAMRAAGADDHDVRTALRERPGHGRVHP
jgi:hypothetical protein